MIEPWQRWVAGGLLLVLFASLSLAYGIRVGFAGLFVAAVVGCFIVGFYLRGRED